MLVWFSFRKFRPVVQSIVVAFPDGAFDPAPLF
jgi:hypothetical protein